LPTKLAWPIVSPRKAAKKAEPKNKLLIVFQSPDGIAAKIRHGMITWWFQAAMIRIPPLKTMIFRSQTRLPER
jgi:hypothetical protein